jgi:hypothetical protein
MGEYPAGGYRFICCVLAPEPPASSAAAGPALALVSVPRRAPESFQLVWALPFLAGLSVVVLVVLVLVLAPGMPFAYAALLVVALPVFVAFAAGHARTVWLERDDGRVRALSRTWFGRDPGAAFDVEVSDIRAVRLVASARAAAGPLQLAMTDGATHDVPDDDVHGTSLAAWLGVPYEETA